MLRSGSRRGPSRSRRTTFGLYAFAIFGLPVVMLWIAEKQYLDRSRANVTELRETNDELETANARMKRLLGDNQKLLQRMHRSYLSTITSLARAVEAKDPYTSGTRSGLRRIALILARLRLRRIRDAGDRGRSDHPRHRQGRDPDGILLKPGRSIRRSSGR